MPVTWANFGVDLHLDLAGSRPRTALETALRAAVRSGRLAPGTRLPSSRSLAADLGLARNTVADAFSQLVAEGWLEARTGSGTWVGEQAAAAAARSAGPAGGSGRGPRYDLRAGVPATSAFPRRAWLAASRAALAAASDEALGYPDPRGVPELRAAVAGYLARTRGVVADPDNVLICAGFSGGLALICRVLAARAKNAAVAVEACGHALHRQIIAAQGVRVVPLPVDHLGADPAALTRAGTGPQPAVAGVSAVVLTPAHQFPLGMTLAPARRTAFARWAGRTGGLIVEDDYDGEYRFDRQPVGALQALAPGQVVYAGTASKSLAPGLRLGWLVAPTAVFGELAAAQELSASAPGALDQLTLARLIETGGYDRQVRQSRLAYRRRRDRLITALRQQAPQITLTGIAAGLQAVAELPAGSAEADTVARAARNGVAVQGLAGYTVPGYEREPAVVIGFGRPAEHAFTAAVARLCAALAEPGAAGGPTAGGRNQPAGGTAVPPAG
ncbi:MAG: PLP-dependent aminotransferase family protein [Streptosporangiaceae bacterium]